MRVSTHSSGNLGGDRLRIGQPFPLLAGPAALPGVSFRGGVEEGGVDAHPGDQASPRQRAPGQTGVEAVAAELEGAVGQPAGDLLDHLVHQVEMGVGVVFQLTIYGSLGVALRVEQEGPAQRDLVGDSGRSRSQARHATNRDHAHLRIGERRVINGESRRGDTIGCL